ncbi:MAG: hypothetical protein KKG64_04790 [Firmicutes bacterium]|nr:hypothetical protein [Bacillota bacterium]
MKYFVRITDANNRLVFQGKPIVLPMKDQAIADTCLELFNDPEPCIIHQSYATQKLADYFISLFPGLPITRLPLTNYSKKLSFIKIPHIEKCFLSIEVK